MKAFDLHPKPRQSFRNKTSGGGILTIVTLFIAFVLVLIKYFEKINDVKEDIVIEHETSKDYLLFSFDILFLDNNVCGDYTFQVLDAIARPVVDLPENQALTKQVKYNKVTQTSCRVIGEIKVPPGRGMFKITPISTASMHGKPTPLYSYHHGNHEINYLRVVDPSTKDFHTSKARQILGAKSLEVSTTSSSYQKIISKESLHNNQGFWVYSINIIGTSFSSNKRGYQIASSRHFMPSANFQITGSLFFHYESSPLRMTYTFPSVGLSFVSLIFGIIGGLFACVGFLKEFILFFCLKHANRIRKSSNFVDSIVKTIDENSKLPR